MGRQGQHPGGISIFAPRPEARRTSGVSAHPIVWVPKTASSKQPSGVHCFATQTLLFLFTSDFVIDHAAVVTFYQEFGERLRREREGRFSQSQLADRVGLSRASIANIERGRQRVPLHMLRVFARELGIEPQSLLPIGPMDEDEPVPLHRIADMHPADADIIVRVVRRAKRERQDADAAP
jgi:transcriptional regulator with XRE-family HTH domain